MHGLHHDIHPHGHHHREGNILHVLLGHHDHHERVDLLDRRVQTPGRQMLMGHPPLLPLLAVGNDIQVDLHASM